jgi:hypothetical protein
VRFIQAASRRCCCPGFAAARISWMRTSSMWKMRSQAITSPTALMPHTSSQCTRAAAGALGEAHELLERGPEAEDGDVLRPAAARARLDAAPAHVGSSPSKPFGDRQREELGERSMSPSSWRAPAALGRLVLHQHRDVVAVGADARLAAVEAGQHQLVEQQPGVPQRDVAADDRRA